LPILDSGKSLLETYASGRAGIGERPRRFFRRLAERRPGTSQLIYQQRPSRGRTEPIRMPIDVLCQGCQTRFQVSEKFAGKKGHCPKCKASITVPDNPKDEVVNHAPVQFAPKGTTGVAVLKPIAGTETRLPVPVAVGIGV